MPLEFFTAIDLNQNQIQEVALENLATMPSSPVVGQIYFDTVLGYPRVWNGTVWLAESAAANRFSQTIGNGVALTFVVNHNLGTQDTVEAVYQAAAPFAEVVAVIQHTDANN